MANKSFADGYIDVAARIAEFREKYPDGSLQPLDHAQPYRIERLGDQTFIVFVAAAYRTPDDPRPGVGTAWEPFPGKTNFTRDSELQNAETSAWGRALVAVLAADTKRGIASAEEVRNRSAARDEKPADLPISAENVEALVEKCKGAGLEAADVVKRGTADRTADPAGVLRSEVTAVKQAFDDLLAAKNGKPVAA